MNLIHFTTEQSHSDTVVPHPFKVGDFVTKEQRDGLSGVVDWLVEDNVKAIATRQHEKIEPLAVEIVPSERCPFLCPTCAYAQKKSGDVMTAQMAAVIVDRIVEVGSIRHAVITGLGEPLTNPAVTCYLVQKLKEANIAVTVYTNGYLLRGKTLTELLDAEPYEIRISINTLEPRNYAQFHGLNGEEPGKAVHLTKQNLMSVLSEKFKRNSDVIIGVSFIITELNRPFLEYSARELADNLSAWEEDSPLDYAIFRPAFNYWKKEDWERDNIPECDSDLAIEALKSVDATLAPYCEVMIQMGRFNAIEKELVADYNRCYASGIWLEVSASGKVFQCCEHLGEPEWEIGNLLIDSIEAIYASETRMEVLRKANEDCLAGHCPSEVCKPAPYNKAARDIEQHRLNGKLDAKALHWLSSNAFLNQTKSVSRFRAHTVAG